MRLFFLGLWFLVHTSVAFAITPFSLPWMNHSNFSSSEPVYYKTADHPHGIFVIETWFYGCPYCHQNESNINALAAEYSGEARVQVLDLGADQSDRDYRNWIYRHYPNHPVLKDVDRKVLKELGAEYYPSTYVLDCNLNIQYKHEGLWEGSTGQAVREVIDELLETPCGE